MIESINYQNVEKKLIEMIPEFKSMYEEHIKDNDKVLPHIMMGDFTRFFLETFGKTKQDKNDESVVSRCISFIELLFESDDPMVQELAQVSFIENLQGEEVAQEIRKRLGKKSQESFDLVFNQIS